VDITVLREMTQSTNVKALKDKSTVLSGVLKSIVQPPNEAACWAAFMLGMSAACAIEGWVAHDPESEFRDPCKTLVHEFLTFCGRAFDGAWFTSLPEIEKMMDDVLNLEIVRLTEDGWLEDSFEHSYLFRYREYAIQGVITDELDGIKLTRLPITPEG
jgi:hypothetical protein